MAINRIFYIFILTYFPKISIVQTTVPVFSNISVPIQVREDATTETLLDSFNVIDPDGSDVTSCTHSGDSGEFDIRQNIADNTLFELYVLTGGGIEYDTLPSFTLSVSCTDTQSEIGTTNILIDVIPNQPPSVTPATSPISVNENIDVQTQLYTPNVSDVENDPFVCDVKYSNPTSSIFDMWWNSTALEYQLYLKSNPGLSFSTTPTYTVTIECWDDFGSSTSDIVVFITPNSAPTFTNLPGNIK
ncbi:uncharacterized protein LOC132719330 [Ruditapes philippinarum]|uniref:uncharacterized protein LOC132719330 n=1 Tax=Ruditapes philippinarum TaxID=129788 RepID=UPI00295AFAE9|nr:uncharacterized protein LOC132719330 [Ruditapes philippinarum]